MKMDDFTYELVSGSLISKVITLLFLILYYVKNGIVNKWILGAGLVQVIAYIIGRFFRRDYLKTVSYTHLTLPTKA